MDNCFVFEVFSVDNIAIRFIEISNILIIGEVLVSHICHISAHVVLPHIVVAIVFSLLHHGSPIALNLRFLESKLILNGDLAEFLEDYADAVSIAFLQLVGGQIEVDLQVVELQN